MAVTAVLVIISIIGTMGSAIEAREIQEPSPAIEPNQTFTTVFEIRGVKDGAYKILFEASPADFSFSGAVVLQGTPYPALYYYRWGDVIPIKKEMRHVLEVSLAPTSKGDIRGQTFSEKITFISGRYAYSKKHLIKID
ncbi:MAG: hypothetical protein Athens071426_628 [Parcubacteria group bacterium Athens0714_26]|nr:MAG: hypothetical protein Athens071426_628 [Parcubacteria group bacterium Athens0714_26]